MKTCFRRSSSQIHSLEGDVLLRSATSLQKRLERETTLNISNPQIAAVHPHNFHFCLFCKAKHSVCTVVDPCLFFRGNVILVIYVDDCVIFTPEKSEADTLVQELEDKFTIEDEGDASGCLGINITRPTKDTVKMNQPALTQRIVDSMGLKDERVHDTPADPNTILTKDEHGPERQEKFHCHSLVGQLNYLRASTRPSK